MDVMEAVDGALDNVKNAMDNAIQRINKEIKNQKLKSDSMCQLKTAHNWQEEKEQKVVDKSSPSYFWRAHTITVLLVLISCLIYEGLIKTPVEDSTYNGRRGFLAAMFFWVTLGMTIMPDGPFLRPHPALWRSAFALAVFYELLLIYILFQTPGDARKLLKYVDRDLGEETTEKDYGGNCRIYDGDNPGDPWHNVKDKVDIFIVAHLMGYWCKTLIFRDWWLTTVISIMFEFMEYSLEHQLANFSECWWDHWILDVTICNGGGTILGIYTLRYLSMKTYNWRGLYEIPTFRGKVKRFFGQFSPHGWIEFTWNPLSSFERWVAIVCIIILFLITELNTFYLKFVLWVPPNHILNPIRLLLILLWGAVCLRETFQLLDDPECNKLGRQTWVLITIVLTEFIICIKFGKETMTKPLPRHIALWWVLGAALLIIYTLVKFYLLKAEHVPKPEKENIIMGSSAGGPEDEDDEVQLETDQAVVQENFTHQTQPNRETKKEA